VKVFLVATPEERARRRHAEMSPRRELEFEQVRNEIVERDALDSERKVSPLKPAKDAVVIDSTDRTVDEVVEEIASMVRSSAN
jgi:cytidylate kinase